MDYEGSIRFSVVEQTPDRVVGEMPIHDGIKNPYGVVHVGAMLWFADILATILVFGSFRPGERATTGQKGFPLAITLNANFISNQTEGVFRAISSFVKRGKTVSTVRTCVYGEEERLIADVTTNHILAK
ncbi:MAG: chemotaxis protein [delta proteobacterium MLS_D]|jgi:1,4-dihydroxy-2-naphthoyl-CoA hydrolase|nr:MAG: chemotaxis protein [delta proteobacterium MLS_D]